MTTPARITGASLIIIAAAFAGCGGKDAEDSQGLLRKTPVTVAQAVSRQVDAMETTVGRLESTSMPALAAETSGRVVRLLVDGGRVVKKGQVLAELDGEPQRLAVASARASVERLEALLANQQRTVNRYQELRSKAIPRWARLFNFLHTWFMCGLVGTHST